jgi:tRNA-splicing endonuclease subunit Sen34
MWRSALLIIGLGLGQPNSAAAISTRRVGPSRPNTSRPRPPLPTPPEPTSPASMATTTTTKNNTPLRVFLSGGRFLVWEPRHIHALRCQHRIVGCLVGALPSSKRQAAQLGPPLSLSFEEVLLAVEEGFVEVVDCTSASASSTAVRVDDESASSTAAPVTPASAPPTAFRTIPTECAEWRAAPLPALTLELLHTAGSGRQAHARVFRDLWTRGWFVTLGTTFGADYLAYPGDPRHHHAAHTVHVARPEQPLRPLELVAATRLANDARKSAVLAHCPASALAVRYVCLRPMGAAWNRRAFHSSHGVVSEGVGPADLGPQYERMVAATAACSVEAAAATVPGAVPPASAASDTRAVGDKIR